MRLMLDITGMSFMVTKAPQPKTEQDGTTQKWTKEFNGQPKQPMWITEVTSLTEEDGATVMNVTTAGQKPEVAVMQPVSLVRLEAIPWMNNNRHGVSFRASELKPVAGK